MSDSIIYRKLKDMIARCEEIDQNNEMNRAQLQRDLAHRFRLSNSEMGEILAEMMEKDILEKQNRLRIKSLWKMQKI